MTLEIIRATETAADDMGYVHAASWQAAYKDLISEEILETFTPENRAEIFRDAIRNRPEEYYLFKIDEKPAGLAMLNKSHEPEASSLDGEIYGFYFVPDYWGQRYTHEAFQFSIDRLFEIGYENIFIWVLQDNIRAQRFYRKFNFEPDGKEETIDIGKPLVEVRYVINRHSKS